MKIAITCILLICIAFGIFIYCNHPENEWLNDNLLAVPVIIEALLLFIVFYARDEKTYRKVFVILLIIWSVVFVLAIVASFFIYGMRGAFSH
ncbi:hypothetical protein EZJ43_15160 [Pedobacter changchengzhani]|uniref:Uncharacterized protein n=1 Tax=Pedobacter changchengzhani TaxID=2529274 RepID=A0A4V2ZZT9_9SPHI|nr:hypothetical protein [Pedobacter changchengzhani]TDG35063.1 hypothetical protein EZJ43_15160 [Pedobacter changchengzhani]